MTVAERAAKVKEAMTEYKALDHEDMVRLSSSLLPVDLAVSSAVSSHPGLVSNPRQTKLTL